MITATVTGALPRVNTDLSPKMALAAKIMEESIKLNFIQGGRPVSWEPRKSQLFSHPLLFASGGLYSSIYSTSGDRWAEAGARKTIHQTGGIFPIPITDKSRGFFWSVWYRTGEEMWKWMALTKSTVFMVKMPKRQYVLFQQTDIEKILNLIGAGIVSFTEGDIQQTATLGD